MIEQIDNDFYLGIGMFGMNIQKYSDTTSLLHL